MSSHDDQPTSITPAYLDYLAIYCSSLALSEDTQEDQVVFYYSHNGNQRRRQKRRGGAESSGSQQDSKHEMMRHVGLAQGMVTFARTFSNGAPVDSVESEKHRTVMKELEPGWWITASITLTAISHVHRASTNDAPEPKIEYSSREVSAPELLIRQLIRAHRIFLLHNGALLHELYSRVSRTKFCDMLGQYWNSFIREWDVMLHGNPAMDIYDGLKLAVGGELGVGVGEEEFGSGEREVLEDLTRHTDGLVDMVVSRFGEDSPDAGLHFDDTKWDQRASHSPSDWLGSSQTPGVKDGVIFTGLGRLSRNSLLALSQWLGDVYREGEECYGIKANPTSARRKQRKPPSIPNFEPLSVSKAGASTFQRPGKEYHHGSDSVRPSIPPPIVSTVEGSLERATSTVSRSKKGKATESPSRSESHRQFTDPDIWIKYLTLGYGSGWSKRAGNVPSSTSATHTSEDASTTNTEAEDEGRSRRVDDASESSYASNSNMQRDKAPVSQGRFLIGFTGDLEETGQRGDESNDENESSTWENRTSLRTLHVELNSNPDTAPIETNKSENIDKDPRISNEVPQADSQCVRVALYVHRPFIFLLLFQPGTPSLSLPLFYRDLHRTLSALQKPLMSTTSPHNAARRLSALDHFGYSDQLSPIHSLLYDPARFTVHSTIPNIPPLPTIDQGANNEAAIDAAKSSGPAAGNHAQLPTPWTRLEALTVHAQISSGVSESRRRSHNRGLDDDFSAGDRAEEVERSIKSARGWWIVRCRVPSNNSTTRFNQQSHDESQAVSSSSEEDEHQQQRIGRVTGTQEIRRTAEEQSNAAEEEEENAPYELVLIRRWTTPPKGTTTPNATITPSSVPTTTSSQDAAATAARTTTASSGSYSWAGAISGLGGSMRGIGQFGKNALATASGTRESSEADMARARARRAEGIGIGVDARKYGEALAGLKLGR